MRLIVLLAALAAAERARLVVYWGIGCPRCEEAEPFVRQLEHDRPDVIVERVEVRTNRTGRQRFLTEMRRLGIASPGIPAFVVGDRVAVGFRRGVSETEVRQLLSPAPSAITVPLWGRIDPARVPLMPFTIVVGLLDSANPCAIWVLLVLLGLLLHVRSRARMALFGSVFVVTSGVVYFLFMTAWAGLFSLIGTADWITGMLGLVLVGMGAVNLKELWWFKQGPSLMVPERVKPGLYRRMRDIAQAASIPAAFVGIATLAFVVNLVELGCTLGLPAMYTRVLSLRQLSVIDRGFYLVLYNVVYVFPLAILVATYVILSRRFVLAERTARALKTLSCVLLVSSGVYFLARASGSL
jgi:hypothetical protein